ncbi:MAG: Fic family protein [Deltaproteobacteria bacterium]|nr:Fic family protein [Deltaproteobacteria bacterium]MBW2678678.1 Fic family protein [Deltaproteobacteria bacterium]
MPKYISDNELDTIVTLLTARPDGWQIGEIEKAFENKGQSFNRRTLQRRLARLEKAGRILITGAGRNTRYLPITLAEKLTKTQGGIHLSVDAQAVLNQVTRPLSFRKPVGYRREFIDSYYPNVTWFLPETLRKHLLDRGRRFRVDAAAGTYVRQILDRLLIDLSWASSRLEGNTYSLLETEKLIAFGEAAPGKAPFETQMVLNHKAAIEFLVETDAESKFDRRTILNLHALLSDNLLGDASACGRLRDRPVGIARSVYEPLAVPQLIHEIFNRILNTVTAISDPFEQAFFLLVHLPYLQPFQDVNKRVSRLAANIPLLHHNLCPLSFMDVPEDLYINGLLGVYELNRIELMRDVFVWTYERSCDRYKVVRHTFGEPDTFRLHYRKALINCVGEAVRQIGRGSDINTDEVLSLLANDLVKAADRSHFLKIANEEIAALHEGNFARYRLRPSEFDDWQKRKT